MYSIQFYIKHSISFILTSFILCFVINSHEQETLTCNSSPTGAKLVFVSKIGDIIHLKIYWDEKTIFSEDNLDIINGECQSCPKVGGSDRSHGIEQNYQVKQTNTTKPTTIRWSSSYCGTRQSMIIDPIELKCKSSPAGAKLVWISTVGDIINLKMYWDEGSTFVGSSNLVITNGECQRCQRVGGVGRKNKDGGIRRPNGTVQNYQVKRTDASKPVTIEWTGAYCGDQSLVIP
ncbi:MAG: hypothetical protein ACI94Y_002291 [Maribacter sp.]|jgi:hypothetical protein